MTSAASALVKIAMEEYAAGDYEGALALADPLVRWDDRALGPGGELVWGRDEVRRALYRWLDGWEDYVAAIVDLQEVGDRIVVTYRESGFDIATGMELDQLRAAVVTVERQRIVGWSRYLTESEAERAASAGEVKRF